MIPPHAFAQEVGDRIVRHPCWCCPTISFVEAFDENGDRYVFTQFEHEGRWIFTAASTGPPPN